MGGCALFVYAEMTPALEERLRKEGMEVARLEVSAGSAEDSDGTIATAKGRGVFCVVVDGYQFDAKFQRSIKDAGLKVLFVDDYGHADQYSADFVLNQNVYAHESAYKNREPYTQLLLGTRFAMLRREFASWRNWRRSFSDSTRHVLVSIGGSDPANVTSQVLQAMVYCCGKDVEVGVIIGDSNPHAAEIRKAADAASFPVQTILGTSDMPRWLMWADVMISSSGSTCWESCFFGLPSILIDVAENQRLVAERLQELGAAIHLGSLSDVTEETMALSLDALLSSTVAGVKMSNVGRQLVDGNGAARVATLLSSDMRLRRAEYSDARLLWEWANDPDVRSSSFSSAHIEWDQHVDWFRKKLSDESTFMFVAIDGQGTPVGQVRFEADENCQARIDISLASEKRGRGLSSTLIEQAVEKVFGMDVVRVHAGVKSENRASIRAFERAGFTKAGDSLVENYPVVHFQIDKSRKS